MYCHRTKNDGWIKYLSLLLGKEIRHVARKITNILFI